MADLLALLAYGPNGWGDDLAGAWLTIRLALATLAVGMLLGFLVALAKSSDSDAGTRSDEGFTTIFRGLPELLTILIVYFGGQIVLQAGVRLLTDATSSSTVSSPASGPRSGLRGLLERGLSRRLPRHPSASGRLRPRSASAPADDAAGRRATAPAPGLAGSRQSLADPPEGHELARLGHRARATSSG